MLEVYQKQFYTRQHEARDSCVIKTLQRKMYLIWIAPVIMSNQLHQVRICTSTDIVNQICACQQLTDKRYSLKCTVHFLKYMQPLAFNKKSILHQTRFNKYTLLLSFNFSFSRLLSLWSLCGLQSVCECEWVSVCVSVCKLQFPPHFHQKLLLPGG